MVLKRWKREEVLILTRGLIDNINGCYICSYIPKDTANKILKALDFEGVRL